MSSTPTKPPEEVVTIIKHAIRKELDEVRDAWEKMQEAARLAGESSEALSLTVARAFMYKARKFEAEDPAAATASARNAWFVATSIPLEYGVTPEGATASEVLMIAAADTIERLRDRVQAQSKRSTVPSISK